MFSVIFHLQIRVPFAYRETVLWSELANVLNYMFYHATDRQLLSEHLHYLAQIFFSESLMFGSVSENAFKVIGDAL